MHNHYFVGAESVSMRVPLVKFLEMPRTLAYPGTYVVSSWSNVDMIMKKEKAWISFKIFPFMVRVIAWLLLLKIFLNRKAKLQQNISGQNAAHTPSSKTNSPL